MLEVCKLCIFLPKKKLLEVHPNLEHCMISSFEPSIMISLFQFLGTYPLMQD